MKKKVAVALSGGIDSSCAAYLLKKGGCQIEGFTLRLYSRNSRCGNEEDLNLARRLCAQINIPHHVIDARGLFKEKVIDYFIKSYQRGVTPNPCAFCNARVKFGYLWQKVKSFNFDYLATGHYAAVKKSSGRLFLTKAKDRKKSQEYFLALIAPAVLKRLIFPLAGYTKDEVRALLRGKKLMCKERQESQDICFVRGQPYAAFIEERSPANLSGGDIRHVNGDVLGRHKGVHQFTYGQRQGLGISWRRPLYVTAIDYRSKTVVVGEKRYLYCDHFFVRSPNWFYPPQNYKNIKVKIRYNSPLYACRLKIEGRKAAVFLKEGVTAVTPGQVAVFYSGDKVLGGGIIEKM